MLSIINHQQSAQIDTQILYESICNTAELFRDLPIVDQTRMDLHQRLTMRYGAESIHVKYESDQPVGAYKNRGGANNIRHFTDEERSRGAILASAGNHAAGTALACAHYSVNAHIYMPEGTSPVKIEKTKQMGKGRVSIEIVGDTFDASHNEALEEANKSGKVFVHPFDSVHTVVGQGTIGSEIIQSQFKFPDFVFGALGGGGMSAGVSTYMRHSCPESRYVGVEPEGSAAMQKSIELNKLVTLEDIDTFVDGAAVKTPGQLPFNILQSNSNTEIVTVSNEKACRALVDLKEYDGIDSELAGALPFAALDQYADQIRNKTVIVILSGRNISEAKLKTVRSMI